MKKFGPVILAISLLATACSGSTVVTSESLASSTAADSGTREQAAVQPDDQDPARPAPQLAEPSHDDASSSEQVGPEADTVTVEATVEFLVQAKNNTNATSSFRFEGYFEDFGFGSKTYPTVVGEVSGDRSRTVVDRQEFVSPRFQSLTTSDDDLKFTIVTSGDDAYLNAPYLGILFSGTSSPDRAWVAEVVTGWGHFALAEVPHGVAIGSLDMNTGPSGTALLDVLETSTSVVDGGTGEIHGVATRIIYANVTQLAISELSSRELTESSASQLEAAVVTVEVHVDADEHIRRIEYETVDITFGLTTWLRVDYFDFDSDVTIEVPTASVEIADGLLDLLGS